MIASEWRSVSVRSHFTIDWFINYGSFIEADRVDKNMKLSLGSHTSTIHLLLPKAKEADCWLTSTYKAMYETHWSIELFEARCKKLVCWASGCAHISLFPRYPKTFFLDLATTSHARHARCHTGAAVVFSYFSVHHATKYGQTKILTVTIPEAEKSESRDTRTVILGLQIRNPWKPRNIKQVKPVWKRNRWGGNKKRKTISKIAGWCLDCTRLYSHWQLRRLFWLGRQCDDLGLWGARLDGWWVVAVLDARRPVCLVSPKLVSR